MDNFGAVVEGAGYKEFYSADDTDTKGFEETNTFGYEDDIMLEPSEEWLNERGSEPFVAEYLLGTGHHDYQCLNTRYGQEDFSEDDLTNHYLNCMRLQDIFVKNLIDQYKELGLYENTIFVLFGDHGEGFGEHDRYLHGDTIYEEGLRVPLIIHAPGWFENGERVNGLSSQIDILPTILEMLGYEVKNGEYPGYSLLHPLPNDRALFFSCISKRTCLASLKGNEKYIYHYDNQPKEVFDLSNDPLERHNLARERDEEELDKRRQKLLEWRSSVDGNYGGHYSA
jgi:lipoteichoic acid synthase